MKPSAFWASSTDDKVYMIAYFQTYHEIKAVEDYETEKDLKRKARKPRRA